MLSPGIMIAIDVTLLYLIMGPVVLFGLYVLFDSLGQTKDVDLNPAGKTLKKDPALWFDEDTLL